MASDITSIGQDKVAITLLRRGRSDEQVMQASGLDALEVLGLRAMLASAPQSLFPRISVEKLRDDRFDPSGEAPPPAA